jgi:hypothetical protein
MRLFTCRYKECGRKFWVEDEKNFNRAAGNHYGRFCAGTQKINGTEEERRIWQWTNLEELRAITESDVECGPANLAAAAETSWSEESSFGIMLGADDIAAMSPRAFRLDDLVKYPYESIVVDSVAAAENYSKALDNSFAKMISGDVFKETGFMPSDMLAQLSFWEIVQRNSLSVSCTNEIVRWTNSYMLKEEFQPFRLGRLDRLLNDINDVVGKINVETRNVYVAQKLLPIIPAGIPVQIHFRDPLKLIARITSDILHRFGKQVFDISDESSCFEYAQDALYLRQARSKLAEDHDEPFLIVPFRIHADGIHMRSNGLHLVSPLLISVVHRAMDSDGWKPQIVTTLPSAEAACRFAKEMDPAFPTLSKQDSTKLSRSLHHGILHYLFQSVLLVTHGKLPFYIWLNGERIRCFPLLYKYCMDMPMIAACSLTAKSTPAVQERPCQQCLARGKSESYYFSAGDYRNEAAALEYCLEAAPAYNSERQRLNLSRLGLPVFAFMNPFHEHGVFLLAAADGLHSFKGLWFRKLVSFALDAMYVNSKRGESDDSSRAPSSIQVFLQTTAVERYDDVEPEGGHFEDLLVEAVESESDSCAEEDGIEHIRTSIIADSADGSLLRIKDPAKRATAILRTVRGRKLQAAALDMMRECSTRRGSSHIPFRHISVLEQVSKLQEHKYSLGILIQMVCLVTADKTENGLGCFRTSWLLVATKCILLYARLYQRKPSSEDIQKARQLSNELCVAARKLVNEIGIRWEAPKIHSTHHFPDSIQTFGRMKLFDTADGETSLSDMKTIYKTLSNREIWKCTTPFLEKAEERAVVSLMSSWARIAKGNHGVSHKSPADGNDMEVQVSSQAKHVKGKTDVVLELLYLGHSMALYDRCSDEHEAKRPKKLPGKLDVPITCDTAVFWTSFLKAIQLFVKNTGAPVGSRVKMVQYNTAISTETAELFAACNMRYGKEQFDMVAFRALSKNEIRFGLCACIFELEISPPQSSATMFCDSVVFLRPMRLHEGLPCSRCLDVCEVVLHMRTYTGSDRYLECVPVSAVVERVTAFKDVNACWQEVEEQMYVYPKGRWYFALKPEVFHGVETYC